MMDGCWARASARPESDENSNIDSEIVSLALKVALFAL